MELKTPQEAQVAFDVGYDQGYKDALANASKGKVDSYNQGWIDGANAAIARQGHTPLAGS